MSDLSAEKKPPERLCPRGAEDTILFRERLDAPRGAGCRVHWLARANGTLVAGVFLYPKRAAYFLASGGALRGPQESRRRDFPRCRPIHVDCWLFRFCMLPAAVFPLPMKHS